MAVLVGNAGAGTNVSVTNGVDWTNPANAGTAPSGGSFASASLTAPSSGKISDILQLASFGLALPSDIAIDGILVTTRYYKASPSTTADRIDVTLRADPPGGPNVVSATKSYTAVYPSGSPGSPTLGGAADLWGAAWTELACEWIYVQVQVVGGQASSCVAAIDGMSIAVYYHTIVADVSFEHAMQHPRDSSPYAAGALFVEASDNFADGVVDPMWSIDNTNGQVVASEVGGFLQYVVTAGATGGQASATHWPARDLRETVTTIELPTKVSQAGLYLILYQIAVGGAGPGGYQQVRWYSNVVDAYYHEGGTDLPVGSTSGTILQRMRIRNTGGYSHFEWYNGSVWASLGSVPYKIGLDDAVNRLDVIKQGTLGTTIKYDNYSLERYSPDYVEPFTTNPLGVTLGGWASGGTAVVPTVTGGRLACALPVGVVSAQYSGANWTPGHVDWRGGVCQVKVEMPDSGGIQANLSEIVQFYGGSPDEGGQKQFRVAVTHMLDGTRYVQGSYLDAGVEVYGDPVTLTSRTVWLRIDWAVEGAPRAQFSYDGSSWTTLMVWSPPWPLSKIKPAGIGQLYAVSHQNGSPAATVYFDDYSNVGHRGINRWPVYNGLLAGGLVVEGEVLLQPPGLTLSVSFGAVALVAAVAPVGLEVPVSFGGRVVSAELVVSALVVTASFGAPTLVQTGLSPSGPRFVLIAGTASIEPRLSASGFRIAPAFGAAAITTGTTALVVPSVSAPVAFGSVAVEATLSLGGFVVPVSLGSVGLTISPDGLVVPVSFGGASVVARFFPVGFVVPVAVGSASAVAVVSGGGFLVPAHFGFEHQVIRVFAIYVVVVMEHVDEAVEMEAVDLPITLEAVDRAIELV